MKGRNLLSLLMLAFMLAGTLLGCSPQTPAAEPTTVPAVEEAPTEAGEPLAIEEAPPAEEPVEEAAEAPVVDKESSTLVYGMSITVITPDIQQSQGGLEAVVHQFINGTLLAKDVDGKYIPYLAKSWEVSEDGLVYTFNLRDDVTWHNGEPMIAQDWVYTFTRAVSGDVIGVATSKLTSLVNAEALDDHTLQVTLSEPYYPFLYFLSSVWSSPVQEKYISEQGSGENIDTWMGVGPYRFVEYATDDYVLLERNPDYTWGPDYGVDASPGPYSIPNVEIRIIQEYATIAAGLEAGEIDFATIQPNEAPLLEENFDIYEEVAIGLVNVSLNTQVAPFDNFALRQAVNYATNRDAIVQVAAQGNALKILGPIPPSVIGYWDGADEVSYDYDPEMAKAKLEEAGYTLNADGLAEKDGEVLEIVMDIPPDTLYVNTAQLLQQQWAEVGIQLTIQQDEWGVLIQNVLPGNYIAAIMDYGDYEADFLYGIFISSNMDIMNISRVSDPVLDEMLIRTRTTVDPDARQQVVDEVQAYITENAYLVPIMARKDLNALARRIHGVQGTFFTGLILADAYIEE